MTPPIYLHLFVTLSLSLIIYAYDVCINEESFKFAIADLFKENQVTQNDMIYEKQRITTLIPMSFSSRNKKDQFSESNDNCEIRLKLKKYNQQLNRSLKTLIYITKMEAGASHNLDQLKDLFNLKKNVQYEVIRITRQINYCKSMLEGKMSA